MAELVVVMTRRVAAFSMAELMAIRKLTTATRVCEGTKNNHVCLLGIKGEAYVASKPSHFYFFYKAAQNVRSKPRPRKYGLRTGHMHGHGRDWARIGHERTGHGRARHGRTGHEHGYGTRHEYGQTGHGRAGHGQIVSERHGYPLV
ncbi:unnamed protein product [Sphagnum jensenii]|uniref:Uncharacterized protein n=1 Tax=Sphagnum jensenii TaxID=128206 RepID=A0ABP1AB73_9BRYO